MPSHELLWKPELFSDRTDLVFVQLTHRLDQAEMLFDRFGKSAHIVVRLYYGRRPFRYRHTTLYLVGIERALREPFEGVVAFSVERYDRFSEFCPDDLPLLF